MPQTIDIQSRELRMIIPKSIKRSTHIQAVPQHTADNIIPGWISCTAVVGVFCSQMRIK